MRRDPLQYLVELSMPLTKLLMTRPVSKVAKTRTKRSRMSRTILPWNACVDFRDVLEQKNVFIIFPCSELLKLTCFAPNGKAKDIIFQIVSVQLRKRPV